MIEVVSYDVWGTLQRMTPEYKNARSQLLARHLGWKGTIEPVAVAIRHAYDSYGQRMKATGERFGLSVFVRAVAQSLDLDAPNSATLALLEKEVNEVHLSHPPVLTEAWLPEVLEAHKAQGRDVAVISNTGMTSGGVLRELLRINGLLQYVDYEVYSSESGVAKPHEQIFRSLTERANVRANQIMHIGNSARADYQGAKSAGLHALLYDPKGQTGDEVITNHVDVFMHPFLLQSYSTAKV